MNDADAATRQAWAKRWRRAGTERIDSTLIDAIRGSLRDPVTRYFDDNATDARAVSPRLQRATQVELLRLISNAPTSAIRDENLAIAAEMRRELLKPGEPARSAPDALGAALHAFCIKHSIWTAAPKLELRRFDETGRGFAAAVDMEAGEAVLAMHESLLLGGEGVLSHPQIGPALRAIGAASSCSGAAGEEDAEGVLHGDIVLALALLLEPVRTEQAYLAIPRARA